MLDIEKIAIELVADCERKSAEWKLRAEGIRMFYTKVIEKAQDSGTEQDNKPAEQAEGTK